MSKHHHHPHEGHGSGEPPRSHLRHNWFFYVAGLFILVALISFVLSGNLLWQPGASPVSSVPSNSASGK